MTTQHDGAAVSLSDGSSVRIVKRTEVYVKPERDLHGSAVGRAPHGEMIAARPKLQVWAPRRGSYQVSTQCAGTVAKDPLTADIGFLSAVPPPGQDRSLP
jgi:hypothetical protein